MLEAGRTNDASAPPESRVVMVVDDDDEIREALADVLSDRGFSVIAAADGRQALSRLEGGGPRPDAIFFDLWMPVMDGWQFLEQLLQRPALSHIPRVVLTAARGQKAKDLNVAEVLTKPVQLEQVLGVVERLTAPG